MSFTLDSNITISKTSSVIEKFNYVKVKKALREEVKLFLSKTSILSNEEVRINFKFSEIETLLLKVIQNMYSENFSFELFKSLTEMAEGTILINDDDYDEPSYTKFIGENYSVAKYMINDILYESLVNFIPSNKTTRIYI